jgi:DNA replication and repair protein RecF
MRVKRLTIDGVRCLQAVDLLPCAGLNLLLGGNGAGKTSVLEALFLLGSGRSFRFGGNDAVIARGTSALRVYAELEDGDQDWRLGFERGRSSWRALRNGERVSDLAELVSLFPVVCFSPESHELIGGGSEVRRRFFDWIVFHVEPGFTESYRRYSRLLKQRNSLLKQNPSSGELEVWTRQLADAGETLAELRARVFPEFAAGMHAALAHLLGEMGVPEVTYRRGWRDELNLLERLLQLEARERDLGYTLAGPHRGDWLVELGGNEIREQGSRGQQKLVAMAAVLVAAQLYRRRRGHPPIVALDDLSSELDLEHQRRALAECAALGAQLWVTGTQSSIAIDEWSGASTTFHVEHGVITGSV